MQLFAGNDLGIALGHLLFLDHLNPNWKDIFVYQKKHSDLGSSLTKHLGTCFNMNSTIHMNVPTADSKASLSLNTSKTPFIQIPADLVNFSAKRSVCVTKIQPQQEKIFSQPSKQ